jgi:hypothetical protein
VSVIDLNTTREKAETNAAAKEISSVLFFFHRSPGFFRFLCGYSTFLNERLDKPLAVFVKSGNDVPLISLFLKGYGNLCRNFIGSYDVKGKSDKVFAAKRIHFDGVPGIAFVHSSQFGVDCLVLADKGFGQPVWFGIH